MLSIIAPTLNAPESLESLLEFTLDPEFEVLGGGSGRFPFRHIDVGRGSYVQAANLAAAAARGDQLVFVPVDFVAASPAWMSECFSIPTALFRQAGGFNEHFLESCHETDLCRRLHLPEPPARPAPNQIDQLLLADLWSTE